MKLFKKKQTVFDFIEKHKDEVLTLENFSEIDTVVFATLGLIDVNYSIPKEADNFSFSLKEVLDRQIEKHGVNKLGYLLPIDLTNYVIKCANSKRYQNVRVHDLHCVISLELQTQSTFMLADLDENTTMVLFGSTDDTIAGWYEDLNLLKNHNVECLKQSNEFILRHFDENKKYIFIGHSKGGMESAYSFLTLPKKVQDQVIVAYDLDGPGFEKEFINENLNNPGLDRLILICPRGSFVGRLFYQPVRSIIVPSTAHGLMQHNPNSWVVYGKKFKRARSFSRRASMNIEVINHFIKHITPEKADNFVNAIAKIVTSGNKGTLTNLMKHPLVMIKGLLSLNKAERKTIATIPFDLLKEGHDQRRKRIKYVKSKHQRKMH